ncbi:MAG: hypothetical protein HYY84_00920 [Deltaproteobacteria bacterium]|nr:hypothetical protein [Deltaproteobacteria bacterium]
MTSRTYKGKRYQIRFDPSFAPRSKAGSNGRKHSDRGFDAGILAELHALEAEYDRIDDPNGAPRAKVLRESLIPAAARAVVRLETRGTQSTAQSVYLCAKLKGWRCQFGRSLTWGDDTAHTTEFEHESIALTAGVVFRFVDADGKAAPGLVKIGIASTRKLHDSVDAVEPVAAKRDGWAVDKLPGIGDADLLIALFRDARGFRKHIWVIRP